MNAEPIERRKEQERLRLEYERQLAVALRPGCVLTTKDLEFFREMRVRWTEWMT